MAASAFFSALVILSFHVVSVDRNDVAEGQTIYGTVEQNIFLPFSIYDAIGFLLFAVAAFGLFVYVSRWINNSAKDEIHIEWTWRKSLCGFVLLVCAWLPYLLSWFPGGVFADTSVVISQATGSVPLSNKHTVLYVMLWRACIFVSNALGHDIFFASVIMQALQLIAMASAALFAVYWLATHGVSRWLCVGAFAFFALFPLIPLYVISLWKDTLFSIALFFFGNLFIEAVLYSLDMRKEIGGYSQPDLIDSSHENSGRYRYSIGLVISSFATAFLRNNGIYVVVLALVALLLLNRHQIHAVMRTLVLPLTIVVVLSAAIQGPLFSALGLNSTNTVESVGIPLQQVARTFALDGSMSDEARDYFGQLLPEETWKSAYRPFIADRIKWDTEFDSGALSQIFPRFLQYYIETGLRNPMLYFEA